MLKKSLAILLALSLLGSMTVLAEEESDVTESEMEVSETEIETEAGYDVEEGAVFLDESGTYSFRERALDLVSRMTLEEKCSQMVNAMAAIPRLGVEAYNVWSEALHGVNSVNCTSYPISIAIGSTWNPDLVLEIADRISDEGRAYYNTADGTDFIGGGLTFWSPVVEPARDPRWGRTAESYSEDTYLTTQLAGAFITGMMGYDDTYYKTVPTAKHFIANNVENTRQTGNSNLTESDLYEYYIKVYRDLILDYDLPSIMTSYNRVNDVPSSASVTLVDTLVRKMWGMNGYVTGDCGAVSIISDNYNYVGSRYAQEEESSSAIGAALSLIAGVDSNCLGSSSAYFDAVNEGYVSEDELDEAVVNMYTIRFALGEFDSETPWDDLGEDYVERDEDIEVSLEAAEEAIVLLENDGILPLDAESLDGKTIALIGPYLDRVELGQYSSTPIKTISPLEAIQTYFEEKGIDCEIVTETGGKDFVNDVLFDLNSFTLVMEDGSEVTYDIADYDTEASSSDLLVQTSNDGTTTLSILDGSVVSFPYIDFEGADYIRLNGNSTDGCVISITSQGTKTLGYYEMAEEVGENDGFRATPGSTEDLKLMTEGQTSADLTFTFSALPSDYSEEAAAVAADADLTILFVGADTNTATESNDRETLDLPGTQENLVQAVCAASDQVIIAMTGMNMIEVEDFKEDANALLWYGFNGQVQGTAIIETLFGDSNPSGHLPFTWYSSVSNLPEMDDFTLTGASEDGESTGRTYMYYDGEISYPFGYGLSYTTFEYDNFAISANTFSPDDTLLFSVDVTNTGTTDGKEVVQLYYSAPDADEADKPNKKLCAFQKVEIAAGETVTVELSVDCSDLWYYLDEDGDSLNHEETAMGSGDLNSSEDLVIDGCIAYLDGEYTFEVASAASNLTNDGPAENSLTVTAQMEGDLTPEIQAATLWSGTPESGKPQFVEIGETIPTYGYVSMNNDTWLDLDEAEVTYASNREDVATIDENGVITAVGEGVVTVSMTVNYEGETAVAECALKVTGE